MERVQERQAGPSASPDSALPVLCPADTAADGPAAEFGTGTGAAGGVKGIAKPLLESGDTGRKLDALFIMIYQVCDIRK